MEKTSKRVSSNVKILRNIIRVYIKRSSSQSDGMLYKTAKLTFPMYQKPLLIISVIPLLRFWCVHLMGLIVEQEQTIDRQNELIS